MLQHLVGSVFLVTSSQTKEEFALKQIRVSESDLSIYNKTIIKIENPSQSSSREYAINKYLMENSNQEALSYFIQMKGMNHCPFSTRSILHSARRKRNKDFLEQYCIT